jgi:hypothetical protein
MTEGTEAKDAPRPFTDEELAAIGAYLPELRRSVTGQRILYTSLVIGFVVGLAAHVGGYVLRSSATTEPAGVVADLLYALGWALWTGVVVVVFAQVLAEAKRRQIIRELDGHEAALRNETRGGSDQASSNQEEHMNVQGTDGRARLK